MAILAGGAKYPFTFIHYSNNHLWVLNMHLLLLENNCFDQGLEISSFLDI